MKLPVYRSLSDPRLPGDLVAGLTVWAVLVPEALAYASIAGVSPVVGLYAAPGALLLYAAFGSSRQLIIGPGAATAALSAAIVGDLATQGASDYVQLTATLAITVGLLAIAAAVLRLGFIANFISEPVLKGFIIGLALTVMVGQLPKLFGIEKGAGDFFEQLWDFVKNIDQTSGLTLLVGGLSLVLVLGLKLWKPVIPASLVAVLLGILAVQLFGLDASGSRSSDRSRVGFPVSGSRTSRPRTSSACSAGRSASCSSGSRKGWGRPRPMRPRRGTRSTRTGSCSGWGPPTSAAVCRAAWWSAAASPRPR
jgi:MFS superfamily sulfate permease-like transporter